MSCRSSSCSISTLSGTAFATPRPTHAMSEINDFLLEATLLPWLFCSDGDPWSIVLLTLVGGSKQATGNRLGKAECQSLQYLKSHSALHCPYQGREALSRAGLASAAVTVI